MKRMAAGETIDPAFYCIREALLFEAPPGPLQRLNRALAIARRRRDPNRVTIKALQQCPPAATTRV
jgi:hypothetical protein